MGYFWLPSTPPLEPQTTVSVAYPWSFQSAWLSTYNWGSPEKLAPEKNILSHAFPRHAFCLELLPHSSPKSSDHRFHNLSASGPLSTRWVISTHMLSTASKTLTSEVPSTSRRETGPCLPTNRERSLRVHTDLLDDIHLHSWTRFCWTKGHEGALRVKFWHTGHS